MECLFRRRGILQIAFEIGDGSGCDEIAVVGAELDAGAEIGVMVRWASSDGRDPERDGHGILFVLWPNLMIWVIPGRSNIGLLQCNPSAPEHTVERFDLFVPDAMPDEQEQVYADNFLDVLNPKDISLVEIVQKGLHQMVL